MPPVLTLSTQDGIKGCGINVAYGLAQYDIADSLLSGASSHHDNPTAFTEFLSDWRMELQMLLHTDPDGYIGRQCKVIADNVDEAFPDPDIVLAYTHPLTSWSHGRSGTDAIPAINNQEPDLSGLASFCTRRFGWSPKKVHEKFESVVWEGACIRMLGRVTLFVCHPFDPCV
jgi:Holliday junction resolvase YEN1